MSQAFYKVTNFGGCACARLSKAKRRKRRIVGAPEYVAWLDKKTKVLGPKLATFFHKRAASLVHELTSELHLHKVSGPDGRTVEEIVDGLDFSEWTALTGIFDRDLYTAFLESSKSAFAMIGFDPSESIVNLVNEKAIAYARDRAGELVGMTWDTETGAYVENPNPAFAIDETTRDDISSLVSDALEEGWSAEDLAAEVESSFAFSPERADMIARTELAFAHTQSNIDSWTEAGVEFKQSILGSEHDFDDECNDNADSDPIPMDEDFPSGDQGPPYHPNCVCALVPIFAATADDAAASAEE